MPLALLLAGLFGVYPDEAALEGTPSPELRARIAGQTVDLGWRWVERAGPATVLRFAIVETESALVLTASTATGRLYSERFERGQGLAASAALEAVALRVRATLRAYVPDPPPPRPPPAPSPARPVRSGPSLDGTIAATLRHDGVAPIGLGLRLGVGLRHRRLRATAQLRLDWPLTLTDDATDLTVWRGGALVLGGLELWASESEAARVLVELGVGVDLLHRSARALRPDVTVAADGAAPALRLAGGLLAEVALTERVALTLGLAAHVVPEAPRWLYAEGGATRVRAEFALVEPMAELGIRVRFGDRGNLGRSVGADGR